MLLKTVTSYSSHSGAYFVHPYTEVIFANPRPRLVHQKRVPLRYREPTSRAAAAGRPSQHMDGGPRIALRRRCVRRTGLQNLVLHRQRRRRLSGVCRNLRTCTFSLAGINEGRRNWTRAASLLQSLLSSASPALPSVAVHCSVFTPVRSSLSPLSSLLSAPLSFYPSISLVPSALMLILLSPHLLPFLFRLVSGPRAQPLRSLPPSFFPHVTRGKRRFTSLSLSSLLHTRHARSLPPFLVALRLLLPCYATAAVLSSVPFPSIVG